ncbi:MAG: response regulator, partial [Magnetococcales bacterium]|nr:response regulator [Magnetococcales bacterium]
SDSGIGLNKKAQERLFKPFSQADGATTRKYGGTGLGLAISKRLSELMGGQIGANSREGEGATFWFRVPMRRSDCTQPQESERPNIEPLQGIRVLGVVEYESDKELLESYINSWGGYCYCLTSLEGVDEKLAAAFPDDRAVDITLIGEKYLDNDTPRVPEILLNQSILQTSQFIGLLNSDDKEMRDAACEHDFATCLYKPVRQSELIDALVGIFQPEMVKPKVEAFATTPGKESTTIQEPDVYDALESGKLLLLAEDNPVNQKVALMQLKKLGYAVHAVANGKEALEAVTHLPYALILMDCQMPVMDGFEATHAIRRMESSNSRHIPIIAMTANAMKGDRERCLKAGMDDYLSKPVSPEELKKRLEYWIPKSAGELPPIDINQLHQLFGNDEEVIRELLGHFLPTARDSLDRLQHATDIKEGTLLAEVANELRGACVNIGAASLAQLARRMERLGQNPNWDEVNFTLGAMNRALVKVEAYVQAY